MSKELVERDLVLYGKAFTVDGKHVPLEKVCVHLPPAKFNDPPWHPISNAVDLKHLGKLGEESAELSRIISRIVIQGMQGVDPESGEVNSVNFQKEMADVIANIELCCERFDVSIDRTRVERKKALQREWHKHA